MSKEAMKLALEVLRKTNGIVWANEENTNIALECDAVIKDLEEALAKQEQGEPSCPECVFGVCHCKQEQGGPVAWEEPIPDFYISELSKNTIRFNNAIWGKQFFSKKKQEDLVVPCWFAPQQHKLLTDA
jgi:hypothetical protein